MLDLFSTLSWWWNYVCPWEWQDSGSIYLALEYCDGGDFGDKARHLCRRVRIAKDCKSCKCLVFRSILIVWPCLFIYVDYTSIVGVYIYIIRFSNLRWDRTCSYQPDYVCLGLEISCSMYDTKITSTIMYRTVGTVPMWMPALFLKPQIQCCNYTETHEVPRPKS